MTLPIFDKGSFRDPEGRVFFYKDKVYRTIEPTAINRIKTLLSSDFFKSYITEGRIINTTILKAEEVFPKAGLLTENILLHEKIAYITYPFEWSFSMLKDAALLLLDIMRDLLENDFILKDGTAWNICFHKGKPCFYDILSIDTYKEGQPWEGLSQFLQEFLYPLMVQSYCNIDFQPLWRSTLQGIPIDLIYKLLPKTTFFKKGSFKFVYLQKMLNSSKTIASSTLREEFNKPLFPKKALITLIKDLKVCTESLRIKKDFSIWKDYASQNSYGDEDTQAKEKFIREGLSVLNPASIIDLGCNTGHYSLIAAQIGQVISCDLDPQCIDYLYLQKKKNVLPVVLNLMNPTPSMGWQLSERKDIFSRAPVESFISLALIHHLCISHNVPLVYFVNLLKSIAYQGIVEWVDKSDPMVQFLLRNRKDIFKDYTFENFKTLLNEHFHIEKVSPLNKGTRQLFLLSRKES